MCHSPETEKTKVDWDVHWDTVLKGFAHTWNSLDVEANQQHLQKEHEEQSEALHFILSTYFLFFSSLLADGRPLGAKEQVLLQVRQCPH